MQQNFRQVQVPKINFIHNKDELKQEKDDTSPQEFINKKRKLSDISSEGSTNTRKESLNDSFTVNSNRTYPLKNTSSDFSVNIPKPIRTYPSTNSGANSNNNNFKESQKLVDKLLKMKLNDFKPLTDYLQKHQEQKDAEKNTEEKLHETTNENKKSEFKSKNEKYSFPLFYFPFGVPMGKTSFSEFLQQNFEDLKKTHSQTPNSIHFVGNLTLEERTQKVNRYLEKKKKRKWKYVRYNIRKDLADQRQRVQGRFVKTNKIKFPFLMSDSLKEEIRSGGASEMEKSNNSM